MAKVYKRKAIHNLTALQKERHRIRTMYKDMERSVSENLSPMNIVSFALPLILSRRGKKKGVPMGALGSKLNSTAKGGFTISSILKAIISSRLVKLTTMSWVKWQIFNLSFFLGKKLVTFISQKMKNKKTGNKLPV